MKNFNGVAAIIVLSLAPVVACHAPAADGDEVEKTAEASAEVRDSLGILPYPIKVNASNVPILNGGVVQSVWGGSMADLVAADAFATCTQGVPEFSESVDDYLVYLRGKMLSTPNQCVNNANLCDSGNCDLGQRWRAMRTQPTCNGYAGTAQTGPVVFRKHGTNPSDSTYNIASSSSPAALQAAEVELNVAEVNLCMAQKMREDMLSATSLLLDTKDHLELMAHVRERAQLSMLQYAVIGSAMNAGGTTPGHGEDFGPALRGWAAQASNATKLRAFGSDAAAAIELHIEATREFGKFLNEMVSATADAGAGDGWGNGSWRARLMHLLYGGDPLGNYGAGSRWQVYKAGVISGAAPSFYGRVSEDNESPQLQTLLGLARQADALYFSVAPSTYVVDVEASAERLFLAAELSLRFPACTRPAPGAPTCQQLIGTTERLPTLDDPAGSLLAEKHGVQPADVRSLVRALAQAMPKVTPTQADLPGVFRFAGAHDFLSGAEVGQQLPGATGQWLRLDPKFVALPFDVAERTSSFQNYAHYFSSGSTGAEEPRSRRFLGSTSQGNAGMRGLGATAALGLAREKFATAAKAAGDGVPANVPFFQKVMAAIPLVGGAIGTRSVSVVPMMTSQDTYPSLIDWHTHNPWVIARQVMANDHFGEPFFTVTVVTKKSDPMRALVTAPSRPHDGIAGLDPSFRSFTGVGHAEHFGAPSGAKFYPVLSTFDLGFDDLERRIYQVKGELNDLSLFLSDAAAYAPGAKFDVVAKQLSMPFENKTYKIIEFVSVGGQPPTVSEINRTFRHSETGHYLTEGGRLGALANDVWSVKHYNWSKPSFDGLGVKLDWFPPPLELVGAQEGESASSFFLREAAEAAAEARGRVKSLFEQLLLMQGDETKAETSRELARAAEVFEKRRLCGDQAGGSPDPNACETGTAEVDLGAVGVVPSSAPCTGSFCSWYGELKPQLFPKKLRVLKPVKAYLEAGALASPSTPSFDMYEGGALQGVLLDQWQALRRVRQSVEEFRQFLVSAHLEADVALAKIALAGALVEHECGKDAFDAATLSGFSYAFDIDELGVGCHGTAEDYYCSNMFDGESKSYSKAPFLAQLRACEAQKLTAAEEVRAAIATVTNLNNQILGHIVASDQTADGVAAATAEALRLAQEARLAADKAALESQRAGAELVTRFGTYRRFHQQDVQLAKSKVANARRLSLYARRAVEADYVVDLSAVHTGFDDLPPPSTWADTVYEPVVDLGPLMGVEVHGGTATVGQGVDRLTSYVENLDDFRLGYALNKYSMVVAAENHLVDLPAPEKLVEVRSAGGLVRTVVSEEVARWGFFCANSQTWVIHPAIGQAVGATSPLATLCGGAPPTKARLSVQLDPWGRRDGDFYEQGNEELRYNVRIGQFALNLEGEGITTCSGNCTPASFINYSLSQFGPAWLSDYDRNLHAFDVPVASTPFTASALAKRYHLQLIGNDFDGGQAAADLNNDNVRRREFRSRPLGATYQIVLDVAPGVRLDKITNIQLLFKNASWVSTAAGAQ